MTHGVRQNYNHDFQLAMTMTSKSGKEAFTTNHTDHILDYQGPL